MSLHFSDQHANCATCSSGSAPELSSLNALLEEMVYARRKFPSPRLLVTALGEEIGELAEEIERHFPNGIPRFTNLVKHYGALQQAILQRKPPELIRKEALQVACVAMRIYEEGDPIYDTITDAEAKL